jgi:hypothetical protein
MAIDAPFLAARRHFHRLSRTITTLFPRTFGPTTTARTLRQATNDGGRSPPPMTPSGRELIMTTQAGLEKKERDFLTQCVGDAYTMLDLLPGVDPNGPALVWLANQFLILRRGDCPPAHAMTP